MLLIIFNQLYAVIANACSTDNQCQRYCEQLKFGDRPRALSLRKKYTSLLPSITADEEAASSSLHIINSHEETRYGEGFDVIIASDVIYKSTSVREIFETVSDLLRNNTTIHQDQKLIMTEEGTCSRIETAACDEDEDDGRCREEEEETGKAYAWKTGGIEVSLLYAMSQLS